MRQNNQKHNGPSVDCYGLAGSSKLNYEFGGYCYESAYPGSEWYSNGIPESRWHAIQHTLGLDFSKTDLGSILVKNDNSGNCYLGAFDPYCSGTDEKWKVHADNEFGTPQHQDLTQDKYYEPLKTHGSTINSQFVHSYDTEVQSIKNKPMTWNLWNIVRHYCYIKYFKNKNKQVNNESAWNELEAKTRKHVRAIYRTFKEKQGQNNTTTFGDKLGGESISNYGEGCSVTWTNSFVQIASVLERNARDHMASLVMFTGSDAGTGIAREQYDAIRNSTYNFRVTTLNGMDDDDDGMRPRKPGVDGWVSSRPADSGKDLHTFQGFTYGQLPSSYVIGDDTVYDQMLPGVSVNLTTPLDMDKAYPESEFRLDDPTKKWIRTMTKTIMEQQVLPIYTTMENMTQDYHDLTDEDMKGITFKLIPQLYWKYEWSFNEYMIHPVGKLNPTSNNPEMYDMLGNVWELVRDDWSSTISGLNGKTNPIVDNNNDKAVIKGGAFDQFCRKTISATRESIGRNEYKSEHGTQANVGFRPSLEYTFEKGSSEGGKVDIFFLFDASASQDNRMNDMMNQAEEIVKEFATDDPNDCHVGSALFMGPMVRLMCAEYKKSFSDICCKGGWAAIWDVLGGKGQEDKAKTEEEQKRLLNNSLVRGRYDKFSDIPKSLGECVGNLSREYRSYKNSYTWLNPEQGRSVNKRGFALMSSRGDTSGGGGGGGGSVGSPVYGKAVKNWKKYQTYAAWEKNLYAYSGVPVTSDMDNIGNRLFTYNPNLGSDFEFPFIENNKGCLSNYFAGCEPVCETISRLLNDGLFTGYPYNAQIGYMFRGPEVPKLIFVFSNEFDNSGNVTKGSDGKVNNGCQVFPGVSGNQITFGTYRDAVYGQAEDYFSLCTLLDINDTTNPSISELKRIFGDTLNDRFKYKNIQDSSHLRDSIISHQSGSIIGICPNQIGSDHSLLHETDAFSGLSLENLVDQSVLNAISLIDTRNEPPSAGVICFPGCSSYKLSYKKWWPTRIEKQAFRTPGYYKLKDTIAKYTGKAHIYIMTTDVNAPTKLFSQGNKPDGGLGDYCDIFLSNDLFSEISDLPLSQEFKSELGIGNLQNNKDKKVSELQDVGYDADGNPTWKRIRQINYAYLISKLQTGNPSITSENAQKLEYIFGLENPYEKSTIVYATRSNSNHLSSIIKDNDKNPIFLGLPGYAFNSSNDEFSKVLKNDIWSYIRTLITNCDNKSTESDEYKAWQAWQAKHIFSKSNLDNLDIENCQFASLDGYHDPVTVSPDNICQCSIQSNSEYESVFDINTEYKFTDVYSNRSFSDYYANVNVGSFVNRSDGSPAYSMPYAACNYNYIFTGEMKTDISTIRYGVTDANPSGTGILKIITIRNVSSVYKNLPTFYASNNAILSISPSKSLYSVLFNPIDCKYPQLWQHALLQRSTSKYKYFKNLNDKQENEFLTEDADKWESIYNKISSMYDDLKNALPLLMSERYNRQFSDIKNSSGESVTGETSGVAIRTIPIFDPGEIKDTFMDGFDLSSFMSGSTLGYNSCVIDLNPSTDSPDYANLPSDKFPMKFCSVKDINTNVEYKTSKIVLNRVNGISGEKSASFTMGSKSTDYNQVNDPELEKYKDDDSIMQGSENDNATITLTNGGAYQRNGEKRNNETDSTDSGFYGLTWGDDSTNSSLSDAITKTNRDLNTTTISIDTYRNLVGKERYFKNKYLFIDPFELTIAQWCYVHGNSNERSAKEFLVTANQYNDMRLSYWKYLMVYEKDKWDQLKAQLITIHGGITSTMSDDEVFEALTADPNRYDNTYNPLTDTRPYYYATYNDVRGSNNLLISADSRYTFDNKDEYQLATSGNTSSFMYILNSKVVVQTTPRIYDEPVDNTGVKWYNQFKINYYKEQWKPNGTKPHYWDMSDETNYENLKDVWCGGEIAGLNFDLPTEAQWEYCCRKMGLSQTAYPDKNLGDNFEQQEPDLDAIAWYKYKMLGSKPEPERFCAWRAAKFIFGITKDKEQVNNVYEENYDSPYGNR